MARGSAVSLQATDDVVTDARSRRGRYDRAATASERARQQRANLIAAVRETCARADGDVTVARLLTVVGCGRNTFYEHFDDAAAAIQAACDESESVLTRLLQAIKDAATPRTPSDTMCELALAWAEWCEADYGRHWALLERFGDRRVERILLEGVGYLHACLVTAGSTGAELSDTRAGATCAALRAVARVVHDRRQLGSEPVAAAIANAAQEVLLRLLR